MVRKDGLYSILDLLAVMQVKALPGAQSTPLSLVSYFKCEDQTTNYRLDYKYNPAAMAGPVTLKQVSIGVTVDGGVTNMQSIPVGQW